jgi:hypothetical protein
MEQFTKEAASDRRLRGGKFLIWLHFTVCVLAHRPLNAQRAPLTDTNGSENIHKGQCPKLCVFLSGFWRYRGEQSETTRDTNKGVSWLTPLS